jgi:hypothetical protein
MVRDRNRVEKLAVIPHGLSGPSGPVCRAAVSFCSSTALGSRYRAAGPLSCWMSRPSNTRLFSWLFFHSDRRFGLRQAHDTALGLATEPSDSTVDWPLALKKPAATSSVDPSFLHVAWPGCEVLRPGFSQAFSRSHSKPDYKEIIITPKRRSPKSCADRW